MKKNLLLRLCLILIVALTAYSCRTDQFPEQDTYNNSSKFHFVKLKEIPQVTQFIKSKSRRADLKLSFGNSSAKSSIDYAAINLESSDILQYTSAEETYYVFNINDLGDEKTIYTLEAKEINGAITSASIIEYSSANDLGNISGLAEFTGTVRAYNLDGEMYSSVNYTEGGSNCPHVSGGGGSPPYPTNPNPNPTVPPGSTEPTFPWTPNYPGMPTPPSYPSPGGSSGGYGSGSSTGSTGETCNPNTYVVVESFTYENGDVFEVLENDCGVRFTRTRSLLNSSVEKNKTTADCDDGSGVIVLLNPKKTPCEILKNNDAILELKHKIDSLYIKIII